MAESNQGASPIPAMPAGWIEPDQATGRPLGAYVWYIIGLLVVVNLFNYMDRMALAVLLPQIRLDLDLSDAQLGLLTGLAFSLFYAVCGIPIARLADRGNRRNIIAAAIAVWSVMTAISGAAQNFLHLLMARFGVGAGEAGCVPPGQSLICDYVPRERRAGVLAILSLGLPAGNAVGLMLAGTLGELIGWRWTLVALGLPGLLLAVVVRLTLREPPRGRFDAPEAARTQPPFKMAVRILWQRRTYRWLMAVTIIFGFAQYGLLQWLPSFYSRTFGMTSSAIGFNLGLAIGIGSCVGIAVGGVLSNRLAVRDPRYPLFLGAGAMSVALPAAAAALFVPEADTSIALIAVAQCLGAVTGGPVLAAVYTVAPPAVRATAGAFLIFCSSVFGMGMGPVAVGALSDLLHSRLGEDALRFALLAPVALIPVVALALAGAARTLPGDLSIDIADDDRIAVRSRKRAPPM